MIDDAGAAWAVVLAGGEGMRLRSVTRAARLSPSERTVVVSQQRRLIVETLRRTNGNKSRAAAALGLSRTQLLRRIRRFELDV